MSHSDIAVAFEFAGWALAIFCSTMAMFLAVVRPHPAAATGSSRPRKQHRLGAAAARWSPRRRRHTVA